MLPAISANAMASVAVISSARYTEGAVCCLAFARASFKSGCTLLEDVSTVESDGDPPGLRSWCGEEETVVAAVLAVRGRSADACATAAFDVAGVLPPPSSIFLILFFNSSSSSHTEAAGPVEPWDSVS